jgi:tetratricopeptide (TPR) repeat protein
MEKNFEILLMFALATGTLMALVVRLGNWAVRKAHDELSNKRPERALQWIAPLRWLPTSDFKPAILVIEHYAYSRLGRYSEATEASRRLVAIAKGPCPWVLVNLATCALVTMGYYREALSLSEKCTEHDLEKAIEADRQEYGITLINRAEALHNLGRDVEAHALLDTATPLVHDYPLAANGLLCLRAWIWVHQGDLAQARRALESLDPQPLAPDYSAEIEYTWAALEREAGAHAKALRHAEQGLALSVRSSSIRNGHFMKASVAAISGDAKNAVAWFEQAVTHPYQGQARYGLLRFAAFLRSQGESERAETIMALSHKLDPESALELRPTTTMC